MKQKTTYMFVTVTLRDELQSDPENPIEVIIKDPIVEVIRGLVYITLVGAIEYDEKKVNEFLLRQLKLQKLMGKLVDSANGILTGLGYSFEVDESEYGGIEEAYLTLDPDIFDVQMSEELEEGMIAI